MRPIVVFLSALLLTVALSAISADATVAAPGSYTYETFGFDKACAPSNSQMDNFWSGSPYYHMYVYIGGSNVSCKNNTNLTAAWVDRNGPASSKWGLMPIWVGPQPPCTTGNFYTFSSDTTTAFNQGSSEGSAAFSRAIGLHFGQTTPVVYDFEPWNTTDTACVNAAKAFIRGWTTFLHAGAGQKAGVYGSTCGSGIDKFWGLSPALDWVWGANWNGNPSTANFGSCVNATHWTNHQRHKQYAGPHSETWNGTTMTVDSDCANGPMFGVFDRLIESACL